MSSYRMAGTREDALERALEESKRSLSEVVDEVILCEKELAKYKQACQRLQDRVQELEASENGSDHSNAIRSLKQMLADQQEQFAAQKREILERAEAKIRDAENRGPRSPDKSNKAIAEERSLREDLERTLQTVIAERDAARNELLASSMKSNLSLEEKRALEEQRRLMRDEFERAQRNAEGAVREQRASEKRFEALAEEMRQVMEERDSAFAQRDEARKLRAEEERKAEDARRQCAEAQAARDALVDRVSAAERARDAALAQKQSEERMRAQSEADIEVFRQQAHTLQVERDAALRENESVLERLDQALGARRLAVAARAEAVKQAEDAQKRLEASEARARLEQRRAEEMESRMRETAEELDKAHGRLSDQATELRDAHAAVSEYKELKEEAERECEAARRQVRGLNEEMLSVLKARDLALGQRDEAFARASQQPPKLLEYGGDRASSSSSNNNVPPAAPSSSPPALVREAEELRLVLRNALVGLQDMLDDDEHSFKDRTNVESPVKAGDLTSAIRLARADAAEIASKIGSARDKLRSFARAEKEARRQLEQAESRLGPLAGELDDLRSRARASEEALRNFPRSSSSSSPPGAVESLRKELRERIQECEALREERRALYVEVKELTLQLNRATPQKRGEVEVLRERLRQLLQDFDRVEAENRRLKGL